MRYKPPIKWTKEVCIELASTCNSRKELSSKSRTCYTIAHRNGWLDEICAHMPKLEKFAPNHWTKENCKIEAAKYNTRGDFEKGALGAYTKARRKGWLDEICTHMSFRQKGAEGKKKIYLLKWNEFKKIYVGISNNPKRRIHDHKESSSNKYVNDLIKAGSLPMVEVIDEWKDFKEIVNAEQQAILEYKSLGWDVLNLAKGGALGGITVKWTKEACKSQALKYSSRGEFESNESGCYKAALRLGIYDEICAHMTYVKLPNGYWDFDKCKIEALKYKTRTDFYNGSSAAYSQCLKKKWLDLVSQHMISKKLPNGYWNLERCRDEALKFKTRGEYCNSSATSYRVAIKNGWLDEICSHMVSGLKNRKSNK